MAQSQNCFYVILYTSDVVFCLIDTKIKMTSNIQLTIKIISFHNFPTNIRSTTGSLRHTTRLHLHDSGEPQISLLKDFDSNKPIQSRSMTCL